MPRVLVNRVAVAAAAVALLALLGPMALRHSTPAAAAPPVSVLTQFPLPGAASGVNRPLTVAGADLFIADDSRIFVMGVNQLSIDETLSLPGSAGTSSPTAAVTLSGKAFFAYGTRQLVAVDATSKAITVIPRVCGSGGLITPWLSTHDGRVYVGCDTANYVTRVNATTLTVDDSFATGSANKGMTVVGTTAYIANDLSNSVSPVDLTTSPPTPGTTVPVGTRPHGIAKFDDTVFVANYSSSNASILRTSPAPPAVAMTTAVPTMALGPTFIVRCGSGLYAAGRGSNSTMAVLNPVTGTASSIVNSVSDPHRAAEDQGYLYVLSINGRFVSVFDCATRALAQPLLSLGAAGDWGNFIAFSDYRAFITTINGYLAIIQTGTPPPAPAPSPTPLPPPPSMSPQVQVLNGLVGKAVAPTSGFTLENFTLVPRYSVYPALPAGLSLDPATGVVSGTPTAPYVATRHWITASAGGNSESAYSTLEIAVAANVPGAPLSVSASPENGRAIVTWAAPSSDGGSSVVEYRVESTPGGQACVATTTEPCVVTGLANGTAYTFAVRARNAVGWGDWSVASPSVTPLAPSITISGSRSGRTVTVSGTTTAIAPGDLLTPWVKVGTSTEFVASRFDVVIGTDETFTWKRLANRSVAVQFVHESARSNTVTIRR